MLVTRQAAFLTIAAIIFLISATSFGSQTPSSSDSLSQLDDNLTTALDTGDAICNAVWAMDGKIQELARDEEQIKSQLDLISSRARLLQTQRAPCHEYARDWLSLRDVFVDDPDLSQNFVIGTENEGKVSILRIEAPGPILGKRARSLLDEYGRIPDYLQGPVTIFLDDQKSRAWAGSAPRYLALADGSYVLDLFEVPAASEGWIEYKIALVVNDTGIKIVGVDYRIADCIKLAASSVLTLQRWRLSHYNSQIPADDRGIAHLEMPKGREIAFDRCEGLRLMAAYGGRPYRRLKIVSDPVGATIIVDGEVFGRAPQELLIRKEEVAAPIRVILEKKGYISATVQVEYLMPTTIIRAKLTPMRTTGDDE